MIHTKGHAKGFVTPGRIYLLHAFLAVWHEIGNRHELARGNLGSLPAQIVTGGGLNV
jgi:hypothetical protein